MKKGSILLIIIGTLILILVGGTLTTYNGLVNKDEAVSTAWSNLQSQYRHRSDLSLYLASIVKEYAKDEGLTLEEVVSAQSHPTQTPLLVENLTPEILQQYQETQDSLSQVIKQIFDLCETYPDLKSNENFSVLRTKLVVAESHITNYQRIYNEAVKNYDQSVQHFPSNIVARIFGFENKIALDTIAGAENKI